MLCCVVFETELRPLCIGGKHISAKLYPQLSLGYFLRELVVFVAVYFEFYT